jgi:hypothetical protein
LHKISLNQSFIGLKSTQPNLNQDYGIKKFTRIWNFDDLIFLDSGKLNGADHRPDFKSGKEVCQEAEDVCSNGLVHVDDVLEGQVAEVEGERVTAETLDQLQVVQRVRPEMESILKKR